MSQVVGRQRVVSGGPLEREDTVLFPIPGPRRLSSRVSDARLSPSSRDVVTVRPSLLPQAGTGAGSPRDHARGPRERLLRRVSEGGT